MIYIKSVRLTAGEAQELEYLGFVVEYQSMRRNGKTLFNVFVRA